MSRARLRRAAAPTLVIVASTLAWALFLTSDLVTVGGGVSYLWPAYLAIFGAVQLKLGHAIGRPVALWTCLIPVALAVALAPWVPNDDPDLRGYPSMVAAVLFFPVMPFGAGLTGAGVWLRTRHHRIKQGDIVQVDANGFNGYAKVWGVGGSEVVFTPLVGEWEPASVDIRRVTRHWAERRRSSRRGPRSRRWRGSGLPGTSSAGEVQ